MINLYEKQNVDIRRTTIKLFSTKKLVSGNEATSVFPFDFTHWIAKFYIKPFNKSRYRLSTSVSTVGMKYSMESLRMGLIVN